MDQMTFSWCCRLNIFHMSLPSSTSSLILFLLIAFLSPIVSSLALIFLCFILFFIYHLALLLGGFDSSDFG